MLFLYLDGIKYGYKTDRLSNTIAAPRAKSENSPMEYISIGHWAVPDKKK